MIGAALGAVCGLAGGAGALLVRDAFALRQRASLATRLDPYLDAPATGAPPAMPRGARWSKVLGDDELARHLAAAGRFEAVTEFRVRQAVAWATISGCVAALVIVLGLVGLPVSLGGGLWSAVLVGSAGPVILQVRVRAEAARRRWSAEVELPALAALLGISLSAGETLRGALERAAEFAGGYWGTELQRLVQDVREGCPLSDALDSLALRVDVAAAARFIETLQIARERGAPVAGVLHSQAGDLRTAATRRLIEGAGRRQVLMLAPVVFLILPVCVLFAFYPALVSLRLIS